MIKFLRYSFAALIIIGLATACNPMQNPVTPAKSSSTNILKSEQKWNCDLTTGAMLNIVSYKEYDKKGNLVKNIEYSEKGVAQIEKSYTYNNNSSREKIIIYNQSGVIDSIRYTNYQLDNRGNILLKINFNDKGDTISLIKYIYNDKGYLIRETEVATNGKVKFDNSYSYTFNNSGDVIERLINYSSASGSYQAKDSIVYLPGNQAVERIYFDSQNNTEISYTFYYNQAGKITEELQKNKGEVIKRYKYAYKYY